MTNTRDIIYYNDTGWDVGIHPGTEERVKFKKTNVIKHGEMLKFTYPEEFTPVIKMWDYGESGLQLLVMLVDEDTFK